MSFSRRDAIRLFWSWALASPLVAAEGEQAPERLAPLEEVLNPPEMEDAARRRLPPDVFAHIASGAGAERTLRRNRAYFERIVFRPRVLVDVSRIDLTLNLFGADHFAPIIVGPTARHDRVHPDAERATAEGAAAGKATLAVSERSSVPFAELAGEGRSLWAQLSPATPDLETRAAELAEAGAEAVVFTIGAGPQPRPDADVHLRFEADRPAPEALRADAGAALGRLCAATGPPVVVKGVMAPSEATAALDAGAAAVCVSNHGGRAVDGVPAAIEALPAVAEAVGGRAPVLVDGGFRRGSDILKGLALGADAVLLGRPVVWALAAYGAPGVTRLLEILHSELALAMGLSGTPTLADVRRELVRIHRW